MGWIRSCSIWSDKRRCRAQGRRQQSALPLVNHLDGVPRDPGRPSPQPAMPSAHIRELRIGAVLRNYFVIENYAESGISGDL
jgi:hypothetical protein